MALQNIHIPRSTQQNIILNLERDYFARIENIITSDDFIKDLLNIESYIKKNYIHLKSNWNQHNKLEVPAENLISYYIYNSFPDIKGIYESTICSDIAFLTKDAIINIDVKTTDFCSNRREITLVQMENNQSSFTSKNIFSSNSFSGYIWKGNLPKIDEVHCLPVLSYIIKINYKDNAQSFELYRKKNKPTITLSCIPNGTLENLFNNIIINGFKTYTYQNKENFNMFLCSDEDAPINFFTSESVFYEYTEAFITIPANWIRISIESKFGYFDPDKEQTWLGKKNTSPSTYYTLSYTEKGKTARLEINTIMNRFDSSNNFWLGNKSYELIGNKVIHIPGQPSLQI